MFKVADSDFAPVARGFIIFDQIKSESIKRNKISGLAVIKAAYL